MWCWRRMEKISWTDNVRNEEVLLRVKEQRNILHEISKRKANWIGHILRRNCLLRRVIEGKIKGGIEVTGRRGRGRRKLLDGLKERRGYSHFKEEALDRTVWRARFGRGFGPVVRQTAKWNDEMAWPWPNLGRKHVALYSDVRNTKTSCADGNKGTALQYTGDRGSTVVKVLCYKTGGCWFDPSWCHWNFSLT